MSNLYPASPRLANPVLRPPVPFFRRQIVKVIGYILLFFLTCLLLLLGTTALATACIAGGIMLAIATPRVLTIIIALALVLLGILLLVFLARFLFSRQKPENHYRTLLQPSEHPRLFAFIAQLATETRTRFPEKIFVLPDVNAAVSYHSGFGSLFRPSRKNLEIGLGLVNSLNLSEFKMVLAHEFGHFSQRRMQLGSYVHALHKRIYHMLYENGRGHMPIIKWAGHHAVLRLFTRLITRIADGIQYLLQQLYRLINREYMCLGREMEFHADAVALRVAGSQAAISAMRRMEMSSFCFEHCLHKLPLLAERKLRFRNLYPVHSALLRSYATKNRVSLDAAQLPLITDEYLQTFMKSRVQFRNQLISQPTREERELQYRTAAIAHEPVTTSSWELFNAPEHLQESMTALIYSLEVPEYEQCQWHAPQTFMKELEQLYRQYEFPEAFHEYYDNRSFIALTPACKQPLTAAEQAQYSFISLYAATHALQIKQYFRNRQDVETLQAITGGLIQARYFEFDGQTYPAGHAPHLLETLKADVEQQETWLHMHDSLAFRYHYTCALGKGKEQAQTMLQLYESVLQHQGKVQLLGEQVVMIMHYTGDLFGTAGITIAQALPYFDALREESRLFKQLLQELWQHPALTNAWEPDLQQKTMHFLHHDYSYLEDHTPRVQEIQLLQEISTAVLEHYNNYITLVKKQYLEFVLALER